VPIVLLVTEDCQIARLVKAGAHICLYWFVGRFILDKRIENTVKPSCSPVMIGSVSGGGRLVLPARDSPYRFGANFDQCPAGAVVAQWSRIRIKAGRRFFFAVESDFISPSFYFRGS
jgi:hypothetical protein